MDAPTPSNVRTTIVGVDGSPGAARALAWATQQCRRDGGRIVAVHVLTYDHELGMDISVDTMRTWRIALRRDLDGTWTEPARAAGVEVATELVEDDTEAAGLLAAAARNTAVAIVLGANGHGGFTDRLLGATTYKVAHRASVPVVVIPPDWVPADETASAASVVN